MNRNYPGSFGTVLKGFRTRRGLTQHQLAEKLDVRRNTIGTWERGDFLPQSKGIVLELARHLHLDDQETRHLLEASLTALSPYWLVPLPRNPYFTGREEILEALHTQLGVDHPVALTQSSALHGLGGVGKTQIALEYAYQHVLEYSAVFWIGAESDEQIVTSLLRIAEVLQLPGRDDKNQQRVLAAVQHWLATHNHWLLIWDNVEDLELLQRFLPPAQQGAMLITTRRQVLGTLARGLDMSPMKHEEGVLFLLRRAKVLTPEATREQVRQFAEQHPTHYATARELVEVLGGLPLALDQAGAYLEAAQCGLPAYLDLFRTRRAALLQQRGEGAYDHPASVSITFTLALTATAERHPAVWDLLRVCALLQPDAIPEELFCQKGEYLGGTLEAACHDKLEWDRVIAIACGYSLLSRQPEAQTLSMHRLVQAVLLDAMAEAERKQWTKRVLAALNALFPEVTHDVWGRCERLLPHVLACATTFSEQVADQEALVEVLRKAADYLRERAQYERAELLYRRALDIRERVQGTDHSDLAALLGGLAMLYSEQGKHKQAELCYQRALQIREQALGAEHPEVAHLLSGLAHLCYRQGKYEQAESLHLRALHIREQMLGSEHPLVAHSLYGLAYLYARQGKYEQAESLYQRTLHIREHVLESTHPDLATSLNGLAILYQEQGKYTQAEALFLRALHNWEQELGPEHPQVAAPLYSLALISFNQGRFEQAELLYQRALYIWEKALGAAHPEVAAPLNGLANLYLSQGKLEQAESLCERALHIWEQALGPAHPNVGYPLDTLGAVYYGQGKYGQAEPLYQRALHIWEQALGPAHPVVATVLNELANLYLAQGKDKQAEPLYQRALRIREHHLGLHHPATAETLYDLTLFYQKQDNLQEARALAERTLKIRSQSLGDAHPQTVATRVLYAQLNQEQVAATKETASEQNVEEVVDSCSTEPQAGTSSFPLHRKVDTSSSEHFPLQEFLDECCERHPLAWCRSAALWQAYEQWSREHQERYPLSRAAFTQQLKTVGYRASRTNSARIWRGITLLNRKP